MSIKIDDEWDGNWLRQNRKKEVQKEEPDELDEYAGDQLIKDFAADALKAIRQNALFSFYKDVSEPDVSTIHEIIRDAFLSHKLSLKNMVEEVTKRTSLDPERARMILRTESTNLANMSRKVGWEKMERQRDEEFIYKWSVKHDHRTSPQCLDIEAQVWGGKTMTEIQGIIQKVAESYIPGWNAQLVPHPNCRSTIVRIVE